MRTIPMLIRHKPQIPPNQIRRYYSGGNTSESGISRIRNQNLRVIVGGDNKTLIKPMRVIGSGLRRILIKRLRQAVGHRFGTSIKTVSGCTTKDVSNADSKKRRHKPDNRLLSNQETYRPLTPFLTGFPKRSLPNKPLRGSIVQGGGKPLDCRLIFLPS
jgi:hypothetical protein